MRLSDKQAAKLRSLAAALDLDEREFVRAFLSDELPTATDGNQGGLDALAAAEPLTVLCGKGRLPRWGRDGDPLPGLFRADDELRRS